MGKGRRENFILCTKWQSEAYKALLTRLNQNPQAKTIGANYRRQKKAEFYT